MSKGNQKNNNGVNETKKPPAPVTPVAPVETPKVETPAEKLTTEQKDKAIIDANPTKTPYELLQLGISNATFEKLLSGESLVGDGIEDPEELNNKPTGNGGIVEVTQPPTNEQIQQTGAPVVAEAVQNLQNDNGENTPLTPKVETPANTPLVPTLVDKITGAIPNVAQPTLTTAKNNNSVVFVETPNGGKKQMSFAAAQRLIKMNNKGYRIIE